MPPFWQFAKRLLQSKAQFGLAMLCALLSAGGFGAGLLSLSPVLEFLLKKQQTLADWAPDERIEARLTEQRRVSLSCRAR